MPYQGDSWHLDLSTPEGRADADQYLADCNEVLDTVVADVAIHVGRSRAAGDDDAKIAVTVIAESQQDPRKDLPQLSAVAIYRLACQRLADPDSWGFHASPGPDGNYRVTLDLPRSAIDAGEPQWRQMRVIALHVLRAANRQQAEATGTPLLGQCVRCRGPITALGGFEFTDKGAICRDCSQGNPR